MSRSQVLGCVVLGAVLLCALIAHETRRPEGDRRRRALVALVALGLLLTSYLMKGHIVPGDGKSHLARTSIMLDTLRAGELPVWSNRWYMGFPGELHYGPLYYLTAALFVALVGGKLFFGTKLLLWLLHLAGAASAYALGMERYGERRAAALLALAYSLCGFHLDAVRSDGKLPLSILFALTPLLFAQLDRLARPELPRARISMHAALLCALIFATHAQYGAYLILGYFFALIVLGACTLRARFLLHALECGLATAALGAWLLAPSLLESDYLNLSAGEALANVWASADLRAWAKYLVAMVTPMFERPTLRPGYLGLVPPVLALLGLVLTRLGLRARSAPYPLLVLLLGLPWPAFGQLRSDILVFFGVVLLAADGFVALAERLRFRQLWLCVSVLLLVDGGEGLVKDGYAAYDATPYRAAERKLRESGIPGRVLTLDRGRHTFWPSMDTVSSGISSPLGGVPQLATRATLTPTLAIATHLAEELLDRREPMSALSTDLLRLIGVRYVLLGKWRRRVEASRFPPVLFAARAERVPWTAPDYVSITAGEAYAAREVPLDDVRAWAQRMQLDPGAPRAASVLLSDDALGALAAGEGGRFELRGFAEREREVALRYRAERPGYVRLAYAHSPFGSATVDGTAVPFSRDVFGVVAVRVPAGEHRLVWSVGVSPLRLWLLALAAATLALFWVISARQRRPSASATAP